MGIPGVWELVNPTGKARAFSELAVADGFEKNAGNKRGLRVGVDAYIWYVHSKGGEGGAHPELRTLFFKVIKFLRLGLVPLFVFDGRQRPKIKRGSKMGKSGSHMMNTPFKKMLDVFGIEWREAPGEAEAELARLNIAGFIDAIITDDADVWAFGAKTVIKNTSSQLSGNQNNLPKNKEGKASKEHIWVYTSTDVKRETGLERGDFILIALLSGSDYDKGVDGIGIRTSSGLARGPFGTRLVNIWNQRNEEDMRIAFAQLREDMNYELQTNSLGLLDSRRASARIPETFPNLQVLEYYMDPVNSARQGSINAGGGPLQDNRQFSIAEITSFCEEHFDEWGHRTAIIDRFRSILWPPAIQLLFRKAAIEADHREREKWCAPGVAADNCITRPLQPSAHEAGGTSATVVQHFLGGPKGTKAPSNREARLQAAFVNQGTGSQERAHPDPVVLPDSHPLVKEIVDERTHVSTDHMLEYRVVICPIQLVRLAESGISGIHRDKPAGPTKDPKKQPHEDMRAWIAASILHQVHPELVSAYTSSKEEKGNRKKSRKGKERARDDSVGVHERSSALTASGARQKPVNATETRVPTKNDLELWDPFPIKIGPNGFCYTFPNPICDAEDEDTMGAPLEPPVSDFDANWNRIAPLISRQSVLASGSKNVASSRQASNSNIRPRPGVSSGSRGPQAPRSDTHVLPTNSDGEDENDGDRQPMSHLDRLFSDLLDHGPTQSGKKRKKSGSVTVGKRKQQRIGIPAQVLHRPAVELELDSDDDFEIVDRPGGDQLGYPTTSSQHSRLSTLDDVIEID